MGERRQLILGCGIRFLLIFFVPADINHSITIITIIIMIILIIVAISTEILVVFCIVLSLVHFWVLDFFCDADIATYLSSFVV